MALDKLTKIQKIGINTATIPTLGGSENVGVVTATNFVGDGSGLYGVTGSGAGVIVRDGGSLVGTAGTINFGTNLNVSAISAGIVTVTNAASATSLTGLSDVTISSPSNGQVLKYNGSAFVNAADTDTDTNTTYSQSSVASGSNVNLRLTDSDGTDDDILITAGSNITFSSISANGFTIASSGGGSGISSIFEDTTPLFGGNVGLNNKFITGSGGIHVTSGVITATSFVGDLTGDVTGNADTATSATTATTATNVTVSANNSTDETVFPLFVDGATGGQGAESDTGFTYNPSSGNLTATKFTGDGVALTGVVTSIVAGANITLTGGPTGIVTIASSGGGGGGGGITLSNGADNRVVTASSASAVNGEANLTFNGTTLGLTGNQTISTNLVVGSATTISSDGINVTGIATFPGSLEISRNGNSRVIEVDGDASSVLQLKSSGQFQANASLYNFKNVGNNKTAAQFQPGAACELNHNGNTIFKTNEYGATVTGILSATQFGSGNGSGIVVSGVSTFHDNIIGTATTATTATRVTVTDQSSDTSCNVLFTQAATGNLTPHSGTNLTFNSSSGALTAGSFVKDGGSSSQFLKADGSIDSNTYLTSGSYLEHVADDNSPQLAADLDLNGNDITGTGEIRIVGLVTATSAVKTWTLGASGSSHYTFTGDGFTSATSDPDIYLERGHRYAFLNNSGGSHPFQIRVSNGGSAYSTGVTNNGASSGYITFNVPWDAPASLYYQCTNHSSMGGNIYIRGGNGENTNVGVTRFYHPTTNGVAVFESGDAFCNIILQDSNSNSSSKPQFGVQGDDFRFLSHDGSSSTEKLRITSGGQVGIGTDNPQKTLNVFAGVGTTELIRLSQPVDANVQQEFGIGWCSNNNHTHPGAQITSLEHDVSDPRRDLLFYTRELNSDSAPEERVRITSGGKIGIGTDDPAQPVHILRGSAIARIQSTNASTSARLEIIGANDSYSGLHMGDVDDVDVGAIRYYHAGSDPNHMHFRTAGNERLRITSEGNLIIAETMANNRPRIVLSAPNDGTNYSHLFGANLQVNSSGTFTTPTANISGGGWEYLAANSVNQYGVLRYISAPDTNATTSTPAERLRIHADGAITQTVALESNAALVYLKNTRTRASGNKYGIEFRDSSNEANANIVIEQNSSGNNAAHMSFYVNGGTGSNGLENGNHTLKLKQNGDVEAPDGNLIVASGHGINFSATSDHGTATPSELLDDYEEGSWTPTIKSLSGTDPTISYTKQDGRYTKIGNVVHLFCFIDIGAGNFGTDGTGDGIIDGLPYTISNNPASSDCHGSYSDNLKSIPNTFSSQRNNAMLFFANGAGNIRIHQYSTDNPIYQTGWSLTQMDNGDRFKWGWTAQYRTDQS